MRIALLSAFATLLLLSGLVSAAIDTGDPSAQQNPEQLPEVLESSGYDADNQTALGETTAKKTEKEVEPMLILDEFGGSQEAEGEREAEKPNAAVKDVHAAGRIYSQQPYSGGASYADKSKVLYASSPFSGSYQHRTNVLDDFHGRGRISGKLKYSEKKSPEFVGRAQSIVDDFYGSKGSFVVRPVASGINIPAAQPSAFPSFYSNQLQQQQNAMPLSPVQPVSIVMNTQSVVPPSSLPQPQTEQSSPEWQKTSAEDTPTASAFQTEQQQVEEKLERIEEEQPMTSTAPLFETPSTESVQEFVQPQPLLTEVQELPSSTQQTAPFDIQLQDEERPSSIYSPVLPVSVMELRPAAQPSSIRVEPSPLPPQFQPQTRFIYPSARPSFPPVSVINQQTESFLSAPPPPQTAIQSKSIQLQVDQPRSPSPYSPEMVHVSAVLPEPIGMEQEMESGVQEARCKNGKLVFDGHCSATFFICIDGQFQKLECSSPLVMNPSISACDDKERVEACQEQGQGVMQTLTETEAKEETPTMTGGEELPLERNEERAEVKMQINDNGQREQYEEQTNQIVEAPRTTSMVQSDPSLPVSSVECIYSPSSSMFALGTCTRGYGICLPSGRIAQSVCAAGQLFDETQNGCVDAAECASGQRKAVQHIIQLVESLQSRPALPAASNRISDQPLSLPTSDSRCDGAAEGAVLPIGKCLATYVLCSNRSAYTKECQSSTEVFSTALGGCILRANAPDCNSELPRVPVSIPLPASVADDDAATDLLKNFCRTRNDGIYRHPTNCASIVQCHGGDAIVYPGCTSGLVFNERKLACDYRVNVPECDIEKSNDLPATSTCSVASHGTTQADDSDCTVFYRCVWGRQEQMHCPQTTVFNPALSICDYPANVPHCSKTT
ncbi:hypothetical protein WR25_02047 [Diploscapter pachys]|uniref:Chitin-binding type-2 domain-containing protein n=1 Tax=Diploscapter pachys TaxID=2018661 RepID=A0A2A2K9L9_9BILA|nr:hypothetical protein WR25_02047 [Diploscapter pachys]